MKAELENKIIKHGQSLLAIFPNATEQDPVKLCKKLRRIEGKASRVSEALCNGLIQMEEFETEHVNHLCQLQKLLGVGPEFPLFINSDPRGYALKIDDEYVRANNLKIERDWGGYGILAPDLR